MKTQELQSKQLLSEVAVMKDQIEWVGSSIAPTNLVVRISSIIHIPAEIFYRFQFTAVQLPNKNNFFNLITLSQITQGGNTVAGNEGTIKSNDRLTIGCHWRGYFVKVDVDGILNAWVCC